MLENYSDILSVKDLCQILHISKKTAYNLIREHKFPYRKIGRIYKIPKCGVINYLLENNIENQTASCV